MFAKTVMFLTFVLAICSSGVAEEMPEHVRDAMKNLVGKWNMTIDYEGETVNGTWEGKQVADEYAVVLITKVNNGPSGASILGWDSAKNVAIHQAFGGDGGSFRIEWNDVSEGMWKGTVSNVIDGSAITSTCSVEFSKDKVVYRENRQGKPFVFTATR
jgi:hypothetical protein